MKILLSFNFFFFLFFFLIPAESSNETCTTAEEEAALSSLVRICHFSFTTGGGGACPSNSLYMNIDDDCVAQVDATVKATNLTDYPIIGGVYSLPADVPEMYYNYSFDGQSGTLGPITEFMFKGEYHTANGTDYPIFEYSDKYTLDVVDECNNSASPQIVITVKLLNENHEIYPIDNYAGLQDVFCCEVFMETCDECVPAPQYCNGGSDPVYEITACGDCGDCANPGNPDDKRQEDNDNGFSTDKQTEDNSVEIKIQPNPFTNDLILKYALEEASEVHIEIIDSKGQLIYQMNKVQAQGDDLLNINTSDFKTGIYFCRVSINTNVITKKIVKVN